MGLAAVSTDDYESSCRAVNQSYGRVVTQDALIKTFYEKFVRSSSHVAAKFSNTDFDKQYEMLDQSLTMALLFSQGNMIAARTMDRIRESHNRHNLKISPEFYDLWINSLIEAIAELDSEFTPVLEGQWRTVMQKALDHIKGGY
ncbi:hypothetical protein ACFL2V_01955 [Pseudomonadota bacterium]